MSIFAASMPSTVPVSFHHPSIISRVKKYMPVSTYLDGRFSGRTKLIYI